MGKKYFALGALHCGLKKEFAPGEEVPCGEKLGEVMLSEGSVTCDPDAAKNIREEAEARRLEATEGETDGIPPGEQVGGTELPQAKVKPAKKAAAKEPAPKATPPKKTAGKKKGK